jgi:hypothetical protein
MVSKWKTEPFRWYSCVVRKHPAVEKSDGEKQWYQNGKLNRLDGTPAS